MRSAWSEIRAWRKAPSSSALVIGAPLTIATGVAFSCAAAAPATKTAAKAAPNPRAVRELLPNIRDRLRAHIGHVARRRSGSIVSFGKPWEMSFLPGRRIFFQALAAVLLAAATLAALIATEDDYG